MAHLASSSDTATWVGSIGTWVVGAVAGVIAWLQFHHLRFRPKVLAYRDSRGRVVVRITNYGAGAGSVEDVDLLRPGHDASTPAVPYRWEIAHHLEPGMIPIPFSLPGLSTAQLVLMPINESDVTQGTRARVIFGNHRSSPCTSIADVAGTIFGTTTIPGGSHR